MEESSNQTIDTNQLLYEGETGYISVYNHGWKRDAKEVEKNYKIKGKIKYHSEKRVPAIPQVNKRIKLLSGQSILEVYS